jgi:hypothetical protein
MKSHRPSCTSPITRRGVVVGGLALPAVLALAPTGAAFAEPRPPRPFNARVIQSGHSLTDPIVPILDEMVRSAGGPEALGMKMMTSTVPGSPIQNRWEVPNVYSDDAVQDIARYDVLVITERAPVRSAMEWHASSDFTLLFFENSWKNGNGGKGAETILYATWVHVNSGRVSVEQNGDPEATIPFRERLDVEMGLWEQIQDSVNERRPAGSPEMLMIPGPKIMAALYDALEQGTVPGLSRMEDVFSDDIHINAIGAYMIALAHFAVIYRRDPRAVPVNVGVTNAGSRELAVWMMDMVWNVLTKDPRTGLA